MDPVENLKQQRFYANDVQQRHAKGDHGSDFMESSWRLAELVEALDQWRLNGGFDPYGVAG